VWCQNPETWSNADSGGNSYALDELLTILLKDRAFYENSGGGVTFSGGEPTLHMDYLNSLLITLKDEHIHTCLETCGYYNHHRFNELILPHISLIYFDLKIYDSELHKKYCKVPNETIFSNFEDLLKKQSVEVLPRIPLIPKITATKQNLTSLIKYLKSLNISKIGLLPYNPLWISKSKSLGITSEYTQTKWLSNKEKKTIKTMFSEFSFRDF